MSALSERNRTVGTSLLANLGSGNMDALFAALADDIVLMLPGSNLLPWAGTYRGHEGITKALTIIGESLSIDALELVCTAADDERMFMVTDERLTFKPTGVEFRQRVAWSLEINAAGKIARWEMFEDTEAVAGAARAKS